VDGWVWGAFVGGIAVLLGLDLAWFARGSGRGSTRQAVMWSAAWMALGVGFAGIVWGWLGAQAAGEYLTGYLIERSLSLDNLFVFALVFASFGVPPAIQQRTLLWGVIGALALRGAMILGGAALLHTFGWTVYLFGAVLIATGVRFATHRAAPATVERSAIVRTVRRLVRTSEGFRGSRIVVFERGRLTATPLLAVLLVLVVADVAFAIDSVPAIFGVTDDAFLVFATNAMALLGLRAAFALLAGLMDRFEHLQTGLSVIMVLIGAKMLASDLWHPPTWLPLVVIVAVLGVSLVISPRRASRPAARYG
jgi:tellurite resistance protein TerC